MAQEDYQGTRIQTVRSRRMQRRAGKTVQRRSSQTRRRDVPAMVARNTDVQNRLNRNGGHEARRRLHLSLATEGAELRLPALPTIRFGWRVVSGVLLALFIMALYFLLTAPMFVTGRVELAGAQRLTSQDVNSALSVAGSPIFDIRPLEIAAALSETFPELETLSVRVGFPARVLVEVQERQPALAWEQSGITVWVDAAGIAFIPQGEAPNLVLVQAREAPPPLEGKDVARHQLIRPEMVTAILTLSKYAPEGTVLIFDPKLGFGWSDSSGWEAYFGSRSEDMDQRIAVYNSIVAELSGRGLAPTLISVAQLHAPYYRMDY